MTAITHIGQLKPDQRNARKHNPRNIGMIANALNDVGAARSIVIDEDGAILAGNGTIEAAAQAGIERVRVVEADGEEIIAVRRSGLTTEQKQRLALYDNRTAELATWDAETLGELATEIDTSQMFTPYELAAVLGSPAANDPAAEWVGMPEYENEVFTSEYQVVVHFEKLADLELFERTIGQKIPERSKAAFGIWYPKRDQLAINGARYTSDES